MMFKVELGYCRTILIHLPLMKKQQDTHLTAHLVENAKPIDHVMMYLAKSQA